MRMPRHQSHDPANTLSWSWHSMCHLVDLQGPLIRLIRMVVRKSVIHNDVQPILCLRDSTRMPEFSTRKLNDTIVIATPIQVLQEHICTIWAHLGFSHSNLTLRPDWHRCLHSSGTAAQSRGWVLRSRHSRPWRSSMTRTTNTQCAGFVLRCRRISSWNIIGSRTNTIPGINIMLVLGKSRFAFEATFASCCSCGSDILQPKFFLHPILFIRSKLPPAPYNQPVHFLLFILVRSIWQLLHLSFEV